VASGFHHVAETYMAINVLRYIYFNGQTKDPQWEVLQMQGERLDARAIVVRAMLQHLPGGTRRDDSKAGIRAWIRGWN
jgi:hypothetical protein